ncbi:MAG: caspase, EACC1-associated type [Pseudonocardiaceae bacterium]
MLWPPAIPDRLTSRALLIGTGSYTQGLPQIPCAHANLVDISDALTGPAGILDPSGVMAPLVDPPSASIVLNRLAALAADKADLLLFYFVGHGVLDRTDKLCLGLPGSIDNHTDARRTSLPIDDVFNVLKHSAAKKRVVIIDCCRSGMAIDSAAAAGAHLLAATNKVEKARFPETEEGRNTEFTGALLRLLRDGIPDGPEYIDLGLAYRHITVVLRAAGLPIPSQCAINSSGELALSRNVAYGSARSVEGLHSRALFAQQVAGSGRFAHAARLWADIVADSSDEYSRTDAKTLRYRHAHASSLGTAGDPAKAVELLHEVIANLSGAMTSDTTALKDAQASHDYWLTRQ